METEHTDKPVSGFLKFALIAASFIIILGIIAYFAIWRVPYKKNEVAGILREIEARAAFYRSIPPEENGWAEYKKALDTIDFRDPSNLNMTLENKLHTYVNTGISKNDAENVDELIENNKDKMKNVDSGFKKNYVTDDILLTGDSPNTFAITRKIELTGQFLILCADRETDLMQASKRYLQAVHLTSNTLENLYARSSYSGIFAVKRLRWLLNIKDPDKDTCRFLVTQLERLTSQRTGLADKMRMYLNRMEGMRSSLKNNSMGPMGPFLMIYINREIQIIDMIFVRLSNAFEKSDLEGFRELERIKSPILSHSYQYIIPPLRDEFRLFAAEEMYSKGMVIAAALKLYKAEKGKYPENAEALVPKYLKTLPYDSYSRDKKFTYRKTDKDNIILYSIGIDGKDDGGQDFDFDTGTGDFVILNTKSPPSSDIQTGNLQPLWSVEKKMKK